MKTISIAILLAISIIAKAQTNYQGPIIDMHVHVAVLPGERENLGAPNAISDILPLLPINKVEKASIITIARAGNLSQTRQRNDSVLKLCKLYPQLIPVCSVHPFDTTAALEEMERLSRLGVHILKLHPSAQHFNVDASEVAVLAEKAGALHMALLFDSYKPEDANELGKLMMLAINHPDTKFIIAHSGYVHFAELLTITVWKKQSWYKNNIWMDVSAIAPIFDDTPFREQLVAVIRKIGVGQFIYGSDFPLFTFAEAVKAVHNMGFNKTEEQQIFHDNAIRLLQSLQ